MSKTKRGEHPGWAIKFADGTWLGGGHGWSCPDDPFYASIFESEKEAQRVFEMAQEDCDGKLPEANIVQAWEPLCNSLWFEIKQLEKAKNITPANINKTISSLEEAIYLLKGGSIL